MLIDTIPRNQKNNENFIQNNNGIIMTYDKNRSKLLSVVRNTILFNFSNRNINSSCWLKYDKIYTNLQGYLVNRNLTITSISVYIQNESTCNFRIINNETGDIYSIELYNESKKIIDNLNIDIDQNCEIQVRLNINNNKVNCPSLLVEYAWR